MKGAKLTLRLVGSLMGISLLVCVAIAGQEVAPVTAPQYNCFLDFLNNQTDCNSSDPIHPYGPNGGINWGDSWAVMEIAMDAVTVPPMWKRLEMAIQIKGAGGEWLFNVGNSYSNDGAGGDGGDFSCDSELDIRRSSGDAWMLRVYGNDYSPVNPMLQINNFLNPVGDVIEIAIEDGFLHIKESDIGHLVNLPSSYLFRLGQPDQECGCLDYKYYAGFKRTIGNPYRSGSSAVMRVEFNLISL